MTHVQVLSLAQPYFFHLKYFSACKTCTKNTSLLVKRVPTKIHYYLLKALWMILICLVTFLYLSNIDLWFELGNSGLGGLNVGLKYYLCSQLFMLAITILFWRIVSANWWYTWNNEWQSATVPHIAYLIYDNNCPPLSFHMAGSVLQFDYTWTCDPTHRRFSSCSAVGAVPSLRTSCGSWKQTSSSAWTGKEIF